jgi:hypothetical protein
MLATAMCFLSVSSSAHQSSGQARPGAQAEAKPTTIVGCLVQGLPATVNTQTNTQATHQLSASHDDFFVRTPTVTVPPGTSVAVGSPGTTSTATSIGTPTDDSFYRVAGLSAERLRPHLGQRIEVQGRLTDNTPGIESTRATTTQDKDGRATTTVETRVTIAGVLHATTIRMVSATCEK